MYCVLSFEGGILLLFFFFFVLGIEMLAISISSESMDSKVNLKNNNLEIIGHVMHIIIIIVFPEEHLNLYVFRLFHQIHLQSAQADEPFKRSISVIAGTFG